MTADTTADLPEKRTAPRGPVDVEAARAALADVPWEPGATSPTRS